MNVQRAPAYVVEDRSLLLPLYKRLFLDPVLPRLPARLSPNAITHAGHFCCFAALVVLLTSAPPESWQLLAALLLINVYVWCDNADGGHARRTGQTSVAGEYLDHGLDLLNAAYASMVSAYSVASEGSTLGVVIVCIGCSAAAITAWEQAMTGVYHLGVFNQLELFATVSLLLLADAIFGRQIHDRVVALGLDLRSWMVIASFAANAVNLGGSLVRVHVARKSVLPGVGLLALYGALVWAHTSNLVATPMACVLVMTSNVALGARALLARSRAEGLGPVVTYAPAVAAFVVVLVTRWAGASAVPVLWSVVACFAASSVVSAWGLWRRVTSTR